MPSEALERSGYFQEDFTIVVNADNRVNSSGWSLCNMSNNFRIIFRCCLRSIGRLAHRLCHYIKQIQSMLSFVYSAVIDHKRRQNAV